MVEAKGRAKIPSLLKKSSRLVALASSCWMRSTMVVRAVLVLKCQLQLKVTLVALLSRMVCSSWYYSFSCQQKPVV
jgi:hypothetical protein